jgi:hypothetical protein
METERNSSQVEWRVVSEMPWYHDIGDRAELIKHLVDLSEGGMCVVPVAPADIEYVLCPKEVVPDMLSALPEGFESVTVIANESDEPLPAPRVDEPTGTTEVPSDSERSLPNQDDSITITKDGSQVGAYQLPIMGRMGGISAYRDEVLDYASVKLQYTSVEGHLCELRMPFSESIDLLNYLLKMCNNPLFSRLLDLYDARKKNKKP